MLVGLLTQESTTFEGKYYQLKDARNEPKGPQQPHPPICIGGGGEKRTLRTAARYAQHWNFGGGHARRVRAQARHPATPHCADIGRDPEEITLSSHVPLGENGEIGPAIETTAALEEVGLDLAIFYLRPPLSPAYSARWPRRPPRWPEPRPSSVIQRSSSGF